MKYFGPLSDFWCEDGITEFKITNYFSIKKETYNIKNDYERNFISSVEKADIFRCVFLAEINDNKPKDLKPAVILNTFLLSLWIVVPTRVTIKYRFAEQGSPARLLDRFQYNKKDKFKKELSRGDLDKVSKYFELLIRITRSEKRLFTASLSTYQGCVAYQWRVAFIFFTVALETMLTYKRGSGLTKRLSKSYACIVESEKRKRDYCYRKFNDLYSIRSHIIHGSIRKHSKSSGNLKSLVELSILLRKLWQRVLQDNFFLNSLEKDDKNREIFFNNLEKSYIEPLVKKS